MNVKVQSNSTNKVVEVDEAILNLTREEALSRMGLSENADKTAIDNKFWHLSKLCDADESEESDKKFAELSVIYDIATGNRDRIVRENEIREGQKKFFGKTAHEWKTYFSYTWYLYLLGAVGIVVVVSLIGNIFFGKNIDGGIVMLGHFYNDTEGFKEYLLDDIGLENPYLNCIDYVVPNDQNISIDTTNSEQATLAFLSETNVVIADNLTFPQFFDYYGDVSGIYGRLADELTPEQYAKLEPVYMSELDFRLLTVANIENFGMTDEFFNAEEYSDEKIMVGIAVHDDSLMADLGFLNLWPNDETELVFGINAVVNNDEHPETIEVTNRIITGLFKEYL